MCTTNKLIEGTKFARKCDECGFGMNDGFVVNDGEEYYCSDNCLHKHYTSEQWAEMCEEDEDAVLGSESYWTDWNDDQSDWQYIVNGGVLVDIEDADPEMTEDKLANLRMMGILPDADETNLSPAELLERALTKIANNTIGAWEGDLGNTIDAVALEDFHGLEEKPDEITNHCHL